MRKLLQGVIDFHEQIRPAAKHTFARLALGQAPDALFIACSDSRVAANVFASTDPGDLFVVRNVGNLVPPCGFSGHSVADESEAAAIEFALLNLTVRDVIVCGHSECGAMQGLVAGTAGPDAYHLNAWLRHGRPALTRLHGGDDAQTDDIAPHNKLSQLNVLLQLEHLRTYPLVRQRLASGHLRLHGWWFDIAAAEVKAYDEETESFILINAQNRSKFLGPDEDPATFSGCDHQPH